MFSKISIVAIGKTQKEFKESEAHYLKQIKTKISLNFNSPHSHLSSNEQIIKESAILQKQAALCQSIIALDSSGTQLTSGNFACKLAEFSSKYKSIAFVIGGSHGLSDEVKKSANFTLSFSKLTLPHQVARIILLEQIFRAEAIFLGSNYHK